MIDLINLKEEEDFIRNIITGHVYYLSLDSQGTHVIQKVIICFDETKRQFVFEEIMDKFLEVSTNSNGLCVIKKLISNTSLPNN